MSGVNQHHAGQLYMIITVQWRVSHQPRIFLWLSRTLVLAGGLLIAFCALIYLDATIYQLHTNRQFDDLPSLGSLTIPIPQRPRLKVFAQEGAPISRITIPRLDVSVMVSEGVKERVLSRAAGHIPGTAFPDEIGNVGIAGHRDTVFRRLSGIRTDDLINLMTPVGSYQYAVEWTRIVTPSHVEVLAPTNESVLTLITCYPFAYIGPAPARFIVRARRLD
jgi:sortase A